MKGDVFINFGPSFDKVDIPIVKTGPFREQLNLRFFAGESIVFRILRGRDYLLRKIVLGLALTVKKKEEGENK